jgi:hypothetical protein
MSQRNTPGIDETPQDVPSSLHIPRNSTPRASSAPPTGRSAPSISDIIARITSAINNAEGRRMQRLETLQIELIQATRDGVAAMNRSAAALERIANLLDGSGGKLGMLQGSGLE